MTDDPRIPLTLNSGDDAWVLLSTGDKATLETPRAFPHGSTVIATIRGTEHALRLKVFRCKKVDEYFRVEGRLEGATRILRSLLSEALEPKADGP